MTIEVTFWGTRGSVPVSGPQYQCYGGSTTCLEVRLGAMADYDCILIDCGSGLVDLGFQRPQLFGRSLVLQTHVHWDHIQGFPFFRPFFDSEASFELWGVERSGQTLEEVYRAQMMEPNCPITLDDLPADVAFGVLEESGRRQVDGVEIRWAEMKHPSGSTAYRFEAGDESVVFSGDVEVRKGCADALVELAEGADVLVMDAQYLPGEYEEHRGFGHSTCTDAVDIALQAGVESLVMTHHDPGHDDGILDRKLEVAREAAEDELRVENARDHGRLRIDSGEIEHQLSSSVAVSSGTDPVWPIT